MKPLNEFKEQANLVLQENLLVEKLILAGAHHKGGQIIFLAGGGASGKGFAINNFIDSFNYKTFDVDSLKEIFLKINQKTGKYPEMTGLNLKNPDDVAELHAIIDDMGIISKQFRTFIKSAKESKTLPNLIFDVTLANMRKLVNYSVELQKIGYKPEDIHIVWVLSDFNIAMKRNAERDRIVPTDILFSTHEGAAKTMLHILSGGYDPGIINGEIHVVLNNKENTIYVTDQDTSPEHFKGVAATKQSSGEALSNRGNKPDWMRGKKPEFVIKGFTSLKVKDVGEPIAHTGVGEDGIPYSLRDKMVDWIRKNAPLSVFKS